MAKRTLPAAAWQQLAQAAAGQATQLRDWSAEALLWESARQGLIPLLDQRLHQGSVSGLTPLQREQLRAATRREAAIDLVRQQSDREFLELLAGEGHRVLLLKGAAMAHLHYSNSYLRSRCDTDVLIRAADRQGIENLLVSSGYSLVRHEHRPLSSRQFQASRESFQRQQMWFDIHIAPSNRKLFQDCLPFDKCWATAQLVSALGLAARSLSDTDLLLHACLHRIGHGRGTERNRLIWLYDIHLLLDTLGEKGCAEFAKLALAQKVGVLCADAAQTCQSAFSTKLPQGFLDELRSGLRHEPSVALLNAGRLTWLWSDLRLQDNWLARLQFAREILGNRMTSHS